MTARQVTITSATYFISTNWSWFQIIIQWTGRAIQCRYAAHRKHLFWTCADVYVSP